MVQLLSQLVLVVATVAGSSPVDRDATDGQLSVSVMPLRGVGDISDLARVRVQEGVRDGVERSGVTADAPTEALHEISRNCSAVDCFAAAWAGAGIRYALWVRVSASKRNYMLEISIVGPNGEVMTRRARCEICGSEEVASIARAETLAALEHLVKHVRPGVLVLSSSPVGASVSIDGVPSGQTPARVQVAGGEHRLIFAKGGFVAAEQIVRVDGGGETEVSVNLQSAPRAAAARRAEIVGWSLDLVGVSSLAAGGVLLGLHHRPVQGVCDGGGSLDAQGICRWRYRTLRGGLLFTGVGVVSLATGIAFLIRARNLRRTTAAHARRQAFRLGRG